MIASHRPSARWTKLFLPVTVGAAAGFAAAYLFLSLIDIGGDTRLRPSEEIAGLIGIVYILMGLAVLFGVAAPKAGAKLLNVEDAEELHEQRVQLGLNSAGMMVIGSALVVLALSGPTGWIAGTPGLIATLVLVALGTGLSVLASRHADEFQSTLSREAGALAFTLLAVAGGGWAILAHTDHVAPPQPIDWISMFAAFILIATFWLAARRGVLNRGPN